MPQLGLLAPLARDEFTPELAMTLAAHVEAEEQLFYPAGRALRHTTVRAC